MKQQKRQTINEEQLAQALKEAGVSKDPIFWVTAVEYPYISNAAKITLRGNQKFARHVKRKPLSNSQSVVIQSARWMMARIFGEKLFGVSEVVIRPFDSECDGNVLPRWQLSTLGNAANNTLISVARKIYDERDTLDDGVRVPWLDVRDL